MRLFTLLVSVVFSAGGIWMIASGNSSGWFVAGFFGLCLLVAIFEPWFSKGFDGIWDELKQRFPGFDYEPWIRGGTDDAKHLCWEKQPARQLNLSVRPQETAMGPDARAEIVIPLSKSKAILLFLGSVAFVWGSIWIWSIADTQTRFNLLFMKGVAVAGASFFGLSGICWCIKVFDTRPGLIIDSEGIVDNSSAVSAGRILWDEITGLKVSEIAGQRFITIEVVEPQTFVERGGFLKRRLNAANAKLTGSPINISSNSLRLKFDDLLQVLTEAFGKYRKNVSDQPRLLPESLYVVRFYDSGVSCTHPDGKIERVEWEDLQRVEILTTDQGPFRPDVFWVLHGSETGCVVPQGATGERELLNRLQKLPGFRNEAVIEAMPSTENRRFLCWERTSIA